jgi:CBS domain-containing protein
MSEVSAVNWLAQIQAQVKAGQYPTVSVRELLKRFNAQRRGIHVLSKIRSDLAAYDLTTFPDFEGEYIDNIVRFDAASRLKRTALDSQKDKSTEPFNDPTFRIGKLPAANRAPVSVKPNDKVSSAITIMLMNDYSQLPVMQNERDVKGVISWRSIGRLLGINGVNVDDDARNFMDPAQIVHSSDSLFDSIDKIVNSEYVLVQNPERKITGIVTTSDLSLQFRQLAEPFLLLSEIENKIRQIIVRAAFTKEQLQKYADRKDAKEIERIQGVADLSLGEYLQLLADPASWNQLNFRLDRVAFVQRLDEVRVIRNDIMHFDPDPILEEELNTLRKFRAFLQQL